MLEKENATLKGDVVGGPPQSDTTNEPAEFREEIDSLAKHIKWLVVGVYQRAKLHENKPLGAKLSVLSRRVEQARKQKEKPIADRAVAQAALDSAQKALADADALIAENIQAYEKLEIELSGLIQRDTDTVEMVVDEVKLEDVLSSMEGQEVESGYLLSQREFHGVNQVADQGGKRFKSKYRKKFVIKYGGLDVPDYSELRLSEFKGEDDPIDKSWVNTTVGSCGGKSHGGFVQQLKWDADQHPSSSIPVPTTLALVTYNSNAWSTMHGFLEWMVLDRADQPDFVFGQEHRLRS
ncbi:unnamed protein product, partial [Prorocentrum cordatum]